LVGAGATKTEKSARDFTASLGKSKTSFVFLSLRCKMGSSHLEEWHQDRVFKIFAARRTVFYFDGWQSQPQVFNGTASGGCRVI
jgi:hypothetical protein